MWRGPGKSRDSPCIPGSTDSSPRGEVPWGQSRVRKEGARGGSSVCELGAPHPALPLLCSEGLEEAGGHRSRALWGT